MLWEVSDFESEALQYKPISHQLNLSLLTFWLIPSLVLYIIDNLQSLSETEPLQRDFMQDSAISRVSATVSLLCKK